MVSLEKSSKIILNQCMNIKKKEKVLIIFDKKKKKIAEALYNNCKKLTINVIRIEIPIARVHGQEPPKEVALEMLEQDVVLMVTTKSLSHTAARRNASKKGVRGASMPGITEELMSRMDIDYIKMKELGEKIVSLLKKTKKIKITTKKGTNLIMDIEGRKIDIDTGLYYNKGNFGNLPAGEVELAPVEGTTNGTLVVDASMAGIGKLNSPLIFTIKDGYAIDMKGEKATELKSIIKGIKDATNIAELGIGINEKAIITGNILEDEKVINTIHIAIGNNLTYGGKVDAKIHLDGVILKPTLYADNIKIIDDGKLLI